MTKKPIIYLLCGLPGSGKTTFAKQLERQDVIRLSLDEELFKMFGKDFSSDQYLDFEKQTKNKLLEQADLLVKDDKSVILDWGFWKREEREKIKSLFHDQNVEIRLVYFKKNLDELVRRVYNRDLKGNHIIDSEMMKKFFDQFEEPTGEGEEIFNGVL